jgi:hypothetical protein
MSDNPSKGHSPSLGSSESTSKAQKSKRKSSDLSGNRSSSETPEGADDMTGSSGTSASKIAKKSSDAVVTEG